MLEHFFPWKAWPQRSGYCGALLLGVEEFVLSFPCCCAGTWSCSSCCVVVLKACDDLLGNSGLDVHEGIEMVEMSVDRHQSSSNFSSVLNLSSVDVPVCPPEKLGDPGSREIVLVDWLVLEQHNVSHLRNNGLILPDDIESTSGELLDPQWVEYC